MAHRGYGGRGQFDGRSLDPALLGLSDNASNGYMTEDESTTSNIQGYPQQGYTPRAYNNSLQTGPAAFPTGRTPYTGSYQDFAAQGTATGPYFTEPAQTLPQVSDEQFQMSFEDLTRGPAPLPAFSDFTTREPVVAQHNRLVGWYIRPQIELPGVGGVIPIESPYDIPEFGNFPPSNVGTPTRPAPTRPNPPRRRPNPPTPIQEATMTPFADPASIPQAAIEAHGTEGREDPGIVHKGSVIQPCRCYVGRKEEIKRPPNAWILYRSSMFKEGERYLKEIGHPKGAGAAEISIICGKWWRAMSEAEQAPWEKKAKEMDDEHKRLYPGWKYDPGAIHRQRFGTVDCKCGAYEYNMEQRRLRRLAKAEHSSKTGKKKGRGRPRKRPVPSMDEEEHDVDDEDDVNDSDAFVPPGKKAKGKQPIKKRKTNTRTSSATPSTSTPVGPSRTTSQAMDQYFQDFQTPIQQTFQAVVDAGRAARQQTPPRELRTQPNISYAEPADEAIEDAEMSGTDDIRDVGIGDFGHPDDAYTDDMLQSAFNFDDFDIDPSYAAPAPRLSRLGRWSRRANASRSFYAR
ncbi:hypothetical protein AC579_94 [Pseudocercospora musae]|uniref:HMG box domain-containing protein n=1 Tax=Pseudocercospora musae TaxID=113226 RepID=A0A139IHS2_9PEZI|nr:hypothetical protein AC579_94 [Pseudocercospora musae]